MSLSNKCSRESVWSEKYMALTGKILSSDSGNVRVVIEQMREQSCSSNQGPQARRDSAEKGEAVSSCEEE